MPRGYRCIGEAVESPEGSRVLDPPLGLPARSPWSPLIDYLETNGVLAAKTNTKRTQVRFREGDDLSHFTILFFRFLTVETKLPNEILGRIG
jgi:hypothetical protein